MNIQPIDDRLLLEPVEDQETTVSGIIIPDTAKEKPQLATIVAVGTDEDLQELFSAGDKVFHAKYGGDEIKVDNKEYLIVSRGDILAIVK